ncbi:MAG: biotin transporter BioY [Clostridia bacterium]|nr:biotin transporter BioY [Clostridia bacterium]
MTNKAFKTTDLAYIAVGTVLIAVCSWVSVPAEIPFTLQTLAVFCALNLIGGLRGTISIAVYLLLGAVGVPVFSNFTGGVGVLFGATGGYLIGFLLIGLIFFLFEVIFKGRLVFRIISMLSGLLICYAFGTVFFTFVYMQSAEPIAFSTALTLCVLPFIIPDIIKMALAILLTERLSKILKLR